MSERVVRLPTSTEGMSAEDFYQGWNYAIVTVLRTLQHMPDEGVEDADVALLKKWVQQEWRRWDNKEDELLSSFQQFLQRCKLNQALFGYQ